MAKFKGLPANYDPWLVLSVRDTPEGGRLTIQVNSDPASPPSAAHEMVVLVHGFNNHMGEAGESYQAFRDRQYQKQQASPPAFEDLLGDFFWPGDADWGIFDLADFLVYPEAVNIAPHAGERLANYLNTLPNLRLVHFVGHSLGCRVILECLGDLRREIGRVVLMAAAVPASMVAQGGALAGAVSSAKSVLVLHSTSDKVLLFAFPPGQTIAGEGEGILPVALGRYGPPAGMAGPPDQFPIPGADHGDYWGVTTRKKSEESPRNIVAGHIADFLKLGRRTRQPGVPRAPASKTLTGLPRQSAEERTIPRREVSGRR